MRWIIEFLRWFFGRPSIQSKDSYPPEMQDKRKQKFRKEIREKVVQKRYKESKSKKGD